MRASPLRTISGRIVLGFLVLLLTFGGVAGYAIFEMNRLGRDTRFVRSAYHEMSHRVAQLYIRQGTIVDYLDEPNPRKAKVDSNREQRLNLLRTILDKLDIAEVPPSYRLQIAKTRDKLVAFAADITATEVLVNAALGTDRTSEAAVTGLARLKKIEGRLQGEIGRFQQDTQRDAFVIMARITNKVYQARLLAMVLGGIAAFLGLLVTIWAVLTLRPLARLRDGARRVAQGDYRGRVDAAGGTEVAELASEFNAMAAAIEEREQELVRSERLAAVGKMAAVITHEVRNPLSSIGLNSELLEEELDKVAAGGSSVEAKALLAAVQKEVDRLTGITEEYLRFARLPRPHLMKEQVNSIVADLVAFQKEELGQRGIRIAARLDERAPVVSADENQLRQALLNLLRNAADAMTGGGAGGSGGGGDLTVSTHAVNGAIEVRVTDTGPGISAELLPRIFEPFFSTKDGGTGLGLALTHQIIAEHGGKIEVESAMGKGTTFVVKLPAGV